MSAGDKLIIDRINRWMDTEKKYSQPGLTVVMFANELDIHPHRLRRIINQHFSFDNFNQFLNHYRIKEAASALTGSSASVTEIAYEVGFSSISSFNVAFKQKYELTPTAYRRAAEAQSE